MPLDTITGSQRGDEGKGAIVDRLLVSGKYTWNVRFQGGANAGHTVKAGGQELILHLIPSGVKHEQVKLGLGQGMIIDPFALRQEAEQLQSLGIDVTGRLHVSSWAKIVCPWDKLLDGAIDRVRAKATGKTVAEGGGVGTTNRGIGPGYANAVSRDGITVAQLIRPEVLKQRLQVVVPVINCMIRGVRQELELTAEQLPEVTVSGAFDELAPIGEWLKPMACRLHELLREALMRGECILAEGGQGRFLSNDCAPSYPSCTSSITTSNAVFAGLGLELIPSWIGQNIGVVKAYQTAVGNHPMPTYIANEHQAGLQQAGGEFGATTGRKRDCCWLNALELSEAARFCDVLYVTKLDVLTGIPRIPIATALYAGNHAPHLPVLTELPDTWEEYMLCQAIYGTCLPGWFQDISGVRKISDLPREAQAYLAEIERIAGKQIIGVGVGSEREQFCV
ncbi:MAG: adenylosuccinate synthetase [Patescibacteria group bacterium]|jgi:adenylosuccinate synthase